MTPTTTQRRPHLTMAQRAELIELVQADPLSTCRELAIRFERLTGRAIDPSTVRRAWVGDYREPSAIAPQGRRLTEAERTTLARACREEAPTYNRRAIARRFEAETGRRLERTTIRAFLRRHLGITAPAPNGRPPGKAVAGC